MTRSIVDQCADIASAAGHRGVPGVVRRRCFPLSAATSCCNPAAVMLRLIPWYQRPDGPALDADRARTERARVAPDPLDATPASAA